MTAGRLVRGALAVTVTDDLRVRSAPRVSDDSLRHTPLLQSGTQLVITDGPVRADDYDWYRVAPIGVTLDDDVDQGWVASADHDGTPWIAASDDPTPGFELAAVDVDPIKPSLAAAREQASSINRFGLALYRRLRGTLDGEGIVISPYSIETALAMARAGAKGDTAAEMDRVLRTGDWEALAKGTASLAARLAAHDGAWVQSGDGGDEGTHFLALRTANMAFAQRDYAVERAYLERIGRAMRSGTGLVDYIGDTAAAREAINGWVSRQTMGRIPTLVTADDVTDTTRLVLVNAVYFKGEWEIPFGDDQTRPRDFTTAGGAVVSAPTMEVLGGQTIPLASGSGWRATELRYLGPDDTRPLAMTLVLPSDLDAFEDDLGPSRLKTITDRLQAQREALQTVTSGDQPEDCGSYPYQARLLMPTFGVDTRARLNDQLIDMGMPLAFSAGDADFSGMTREERLHIGFVVHQANIDVDERGTEAAAATAVGMDTGGCTGPQPAETRILRLNKPFLFLIRDLETGAILFLGRVTDPTAR